MAKRTLRTHLGLVGLVVLTLSVLGAAGFAPSARSASAVGSTVRSTSSRTPMGRLTISVTGKTAKSISSSGPGSSIGNIIPGTDYCLKVSISSAYAMNTNEVEPIGEVVNGCSFTVTNIRLHIYGYVQCEGIAFNGSDYTKLPDLSPGATQDWTAQMTGKCEVCSNGMPIAWPPFTIVSQADASGTGYGNVNVEDTGTAEDQTSMQNSSAYSFPCP